MIDEKITKELQQWLDKKSRTEDEIREGAMILLRLNRNQALYQNVMLRPKRLEATLEHELRKFLPIRQRNQTLSEIEENAKAVYAELKPAIENEPKENSEKEDSEKDLPAHGGKRQDHELLPENIRNIWQQNAERWKKIKELYNTCQSLEQPCDLAESLQVLKETWYKYKSEFERYDNYILSKNDESSASEETPSQIAKEISNAKSYISKALKDDKLLTLKESALAENADEKAMKSYRTLLDNVQQRVDLLIETKQTIGEEIRNKLKAGGVTFPSEEPAENIDSQNTEDVKGQEN